MIYCVEDDIGIRDLVVYTLNNSGFQAEGFESGEELFCALEHKTPQLILLDVMLPGEDGISILKKLRHNIVTSNIPIIMLTAKSTEFDKVIGLDSGADDYISKPFGMMELISRIKALLRRTQRVDNTEEYCYKDVKLKTKSHTVTVKDEVVDLTLKEFEILKKLLKNKGAVLTRDSLLLDIWGYDFDGETRTVDVHIRTLRQKLGNSGYIVETVRGVGYRIGGNQ